MSASQTEAILGEFSSHEIGEIVDKQKANIKPTSKTAIQTTVCQNRLQIRKYLFVDCVIHSLYSFLILCLMITPKTFIIFNNLTTHFN